MEWVCNMTIPAKSNQARRQGVSGKSEEDPRAGKMPARYQVQFA
jgi:hypothetical protein